MTYEQLINEQINSFSKKQIKALALLNDMYQDQAIGSVFNYSIMNFLKSNKFITLKFKDGYWRNVNNFKSNDFHMLRDELKIRGLI